MRPSRTPHSSSLRCAAQSACNAPSTQKPGNSPLNHTREPDERSHVVKPNGTERLLPAYDVESRSLQVARRAVKVPAREWARYAGQKEFDQLAVVPLPDLFCNKVSAGL